MSGESSQRVYLVCGSALLLAFAFAATLGIVTYASGNQLELMAVILLTGSMGVLLLNSTMLCASGGGPKVQTAGKVLLWLSFAAMVAAVVLVIMSMSRSF